MRRLPLLILAAVLAGCGTTIGSAVASLSPDAAARGYRLVSRPAPLPRGRVTFDCGPEAVCSILQFHGLPADVDDVTRQIYDPKRNGTLSVLIPDLARRKGLANEVVPGSIGRLKGSVDRDRPAMIMVRVDEELFHFFVVTGYSDLERRIVCEEYGGAKRLVAYEQLMELWKPASWWCMEFFPAAATDDLEAAEAFLGQGETGRALELYARALKREPGLADAWAGVGDCLYEMGLRRLAREAYENALWLHSDHKVALVNLADLLVSSRESLDRARSLAERGVDLWSAERKNLQAELPRASPHNRAKVKEELVIAESCLAGAFGTLGQAEAALGESVLSISSFKASLDLIALTEFGARARRLIEIGDEYRRLKMEHEARLHFTQAMETAKQAKDPDLEREAGEKLK